MTLGQPPFGSSPAWLPGERRGESARAWWRDLARNVSALMERYPRALADVPTSWWREADLAEQLGAVCAWRLDLDGGGCADPRAELAFHEALAHLQERLALRARVGLLDGTRPPGSRNTAAPIRAAELERDLTAFLDEHGASREEAFRSPKAGRPVDDL
jgi:hypothetical protein